MLIEFSVKNFLSFKDRTTFTMKASSDKSLKDNVALIDKEKLLKVTAIYGANASGKTNIFKILALVGDMISRSNFNAPNIMLPITPFKFNDKSRVSPSEFDIKFMVDGIKYEYGFVADSKKIYEEYLTYYPSGRPANIFKRMNVNDYKFSRAEEKKLNEIKVKNTSNKFFVATATTWNYEKTQPAYDFLTEKLRVILSYDQVENYSFNKYYDDEDKKIENFALSFLQKADLNIKGYKVTKEKITEDFRVGVPESFRPLFPLDAPLYRVNTKHIIDGKEYELDISEESLGTQVVFSVIPVLKDVLDNGKILIIDEFDKSLHPYIVNYIVEIINDPDINKNNSQLIFNTHDTNLLDLEILRRDQIWFTEKDNHSEASVIYPLDNFAVRKNENVERGYLLGRYGAIPFLEK